MATVVKFLIRQEDLLSSNQLHASWLLSFDNHVSRPPLLKIELI